MTKGTDRTRFPHYSTHAADFFKMFAGTLTRRVGIANDLELFLEQYLHDAVKFLLPDNGYLFAEHDFKPEMFDLLRLPFPACALEFTAGAELYSEDHGLAESKKRIALCFDPHALPDLQKQRLARLFADPAWESALPPAALCVIAVFEIDELWGASVGMVIIDLEGDRPLKVADITDENIRQTLSGMTSKLGRINTKHGLPASFHVFTSRATALSIPPAAALDNLYIDTVDETRAVYEFLAAINCANVDVLVTPAPAMLNKKRAQKGKAPFFPYHVLNLFPTNYGSSGTGTHASPHTHLRRGHLRRLGEKFGNKVIWINAAVVNPGRAPSS